MSIRETAAVFNIPAPSTVYQWLRKLGNGGLDALNPKKKGRPSMKNDNQKNKKKPETTKTVKGSIKSLQAENERLRMENAYLKKLNALVQNKKKSPK